MTTLSVRQEEPSLLTSLRRLYGKLSGGRRIQLVAVALLMLAGSLAELFSLAAVVPFLAVLAEPERFWNTSQVEVWAGLLGWREASDLVMPATFLFAGAAILAGALRLLTLRSSIRLANAIGSDLSIEVYRRILYQPYSVHLNRNSSEVINVVSNEVDAVVRLLNGLLQICTSGLVSLSVASVLLIVQPTASLIAASVLVVGYGLFWGLSRRTLQRIGPEILADQTQLIRCLQDGLGAITDVLLDGSQPVYIEAYGDAARRFRRQSGVGEFLLFAPRYAIEAISLVVIAIAVMVLVSTHGYSNLGLLPTLGTLALGAQRLLPSIQLIYAKWGFCKINMPSLLSVLDYLEQSISPESLALRPPALPLKQCIQFKNVGFRYNSDQSWVLQSVDFTIRRGEWIGIVGETGSGKSTLINLFMGLLNPVEGQILVDGVLLEGFTKRRWQATVAHVPQAIYLADKSIAQNIALGIPLSSIDPVRLRRAAAQAQIEAFIDSLPLGFDTPVGERGICLSGGQRQRIGIARALYREATIFVFDEATSALDARTENEVIQSLYDLNRDFTVVMIAHRSSTLKGCNRLIHLDNGHVLEQALNV